MRAFAFIERYFWLVLVDEFVVTAGVDREVLVIVCRLISARISSLVLVLGVELGSAVVGCGMGWRTDASPTRSTFLLHSSTKIGSSRCKIF
jgi:hypothetical protein